MATFATYSGTEVDTLKKTMQDTVHEENAGEERRPHLPVGNPINAFLIYACTTFAAASLLFGYDDKVISPIVALQPFVRCMTKYYQVLSFNDRRRSTNFKGRIHTLASSSSLRETKIFFSRFPWLDQFLEPFLPIL